MSWFKPTEYSFIQNLAINVIKQGNIPSHVAFIMDGNRRYAKKSNLVRNNGHVQGFEKLSHILGWCKDFNIKEVTLYAFSIENFKRSKEEVNDLFDIAREKFSKLLELNHELDENGICVRVFGKLDLLPSDLQQIISSVVLSTQHNNKSFLNVCIAYTSRHEIATAIDKLLIGVEKGLINRNDVSETLLDKCLYTQGRNPDLLIRTAGELRLSDFLLWQSGFTVLAFPNVLWPEFSIWHFIRCIIYYQRHERSIERSKQAYYLKLEKLEKCNLNQKWQTTCDQEKSFEEFEKHDSLRMQHFLEQLNHQELDKLLFMKQGLGVQKSVPESEII